MAASLFFMSPYSINTQIYIGQNEERSFSFDDIKKKIITAKEKTGLSRLMIWSVNTGLSKDITATCRENDIIPYLWFPVLADVPTYQPDVNDLVLTSSGRRGSGKTGRWKVLGKGDENFLFTCPNNHDAIDHIFKIYIKRLNDIKPDGVMLDRIRYPSFVNGFESLFTCFCDHCQRRFFIEYNFNLNVYKKIFTGFLNRLKDCDIKQLTAFDNPSSIWDHSELKEFFKFKQNSVFNVVSQFSNYARSLGLKVGLDLYSITLAPVVSQNYRLLSSLCDWIKPMTYCRGIGPAAFPLEIVCLADAFETLRPELEKQQIHTILQNITGWPLPIDMGNNLLNQGLPEETLGIELKRINDLNIEPHIEIYPGIEAIKNKEFNIEISESILDKYFQYIAGRVDGLMASWNLLYIPDENLEFMGKYFN